MAGTEEDPIVYPPLEMPDTVERHAVRIWSHGVALDGDIYRPKQLGADEKVPGVVLTHGIGGDKLTPERYAAKFAASRMIALSFTHASWAGSQGRILPVDDLPVADENGEATVRVRLIRELLDPLEWVESYISAIDYIEGEPNVDVTRIGAWGTSFGGGTAFYSAAEDNRIKALAVQVPAVFSAPDPMKTLGHQRAIQIARGEFDAIPQSTDTMPGLKGTPHFARLARFKVAEKADELDVPTLIIDAGDEEMFDTTQSGGAAHKRLKSRGVETHYEVIPGIGHYGIYFEGFEPGSRLAHDWFVKHL